MVHDLLLNIYLLRYRFVSALRCLLRPVLLFFSSPAPILETTQSSWENHFRLSSDFIGLRLPKNSPETSKRKRGKRRESWNLSSRSAIQKSRSLSAVAEPESKFSLTQKAAKAETRSSTTAFLADPFFLDVGRRYKRRRDGNRSRFTLKLLQVKQNNNVKGDFE